MIELSIVLKTSPVSRDLLLKCLAPIRSIQIIGHFIIRWFLLSFFSRAVLAQIILNLAYLPRCQDYWLSVAVKATC